MLVSHSVNVAALYPSSSLFLPVLVKAVNYFFEVVESMGLLCRSQSMVDTIEFVGSCYTSNCIHMYIWRIPTLLISFASSLLSFSLISLLPSLYFHLPAPFFISLSISLSISLPLLQSLSYSLSLFCENPTDAKDDRTSRQCWAFTDLFFFCPSCITCLSDITS